LIPFKAKAWLDLMERKKHNPSLSSRDIKKHKNDVTRLASLLISNEVCELPPRVQEDMNQFMALYRQEPTDPKSLKLPITSAEIIEVLDQVYRTK